MSNPSSTPIVYISSNGRLVSNMWGIESVQHSLFARILDSQKLIWSTFRNAGFGRIA
jgi:hypothetical protein